MRLTAARRAGPAPFEGDLTLHLHGLPPDAVVKTASVTLTPSPTLGGEEPFTYVLLPGDPGALGCTVTSGADFAEVDLHARRTLRGLSGTELRGATLQADAGGVFLKIAENGTVAGPDDPELTLDGDSSDLPGLTVSRFRLSGVGDGAVVSSVTVRSVPTNVSVRAGTLPPFWTRVGELASEETTPDFAAVLQEALRTAEVVNGSAQVAVTVHSDALCRLDVACTIEYLRVQEALPPGLPEATFAFDHSSLATGTPAVLSVDLPAGAVVAPGGTFGRVTGAFDSSRVARGALGEVVPPVVVRVAADRSQAHPVEALVDERISGLDLLLLAAPGGANLALTLVSDADGKPWDQPLLAQPVNVRVSRDPGGRPAWLNAPLPAEVRLEAGRRYWVVLQCLEGAAEWAAEPSSTEGPGVQTSLDAGLSWRPATAVGATAPLEAFVRLRKVPEAFEMPVRVEVGAPGRIDLAPGAPARSAGPASLVTLDRFAPLGRLELDLDLPELGEAVGSVVTRAAPEASPCPEVEHLSNGTFSSWMPAFDIGREAELPEHWVLTAGNVAGLGDADAAILGSQDARTGLSQVVPVAAGCHYEAEVVTRRRPSRPEEAALELLWVGDEALRIDRVEIGSPAPAKTEEPAGAGSEGAAPATAMQARGGATVHGLDVIAPEGATQVEVRLHVARGAFLVVDQVSLQATTGGLVNGGLRRSGPDGVPAGWTLATGAIDELALEAGAGGVVLGNDGVTEARLLQRVAAEAGAALEIELEADVPPDVTVPARLEVEWLDAADVPVAPAIVQPLTHGAFDPRVVRSTVPAGAASAALVFVLPPGEPEAVEVRRLTLRFPSSVTVPLTFVADAPGELTVSGPRVAYDVSPTQLPPVPPGGLWPATPPGRQPAPPAPESGRPPREARRHGGSVPAGDTTVRPRGGAAVATSAVHGIGPQRERALAAAGIASVEELARAEPETVTVALGVRGPSVDAIVAEARRVASRGTEVRWVDKPFRFDPRRRIVAVGGVEPDGGHWRLTQEQAVTAIEAGELSLYVEAPVGDPVSVVVARRGNVKYLKTEADGDLPNNLLSLPEFPAEAKTEIRRRGTSEG